MKLRWFSLILFFALFCDAQIVQPPSVVAVSTSGNSNLNTGNTSKTFQFTDSITSDKVTAVVWSGKFPKSAFHYNRTISGISTVGNVTLNLGSGEEAINPDIVIGNDGNKILVVYQIFDRIDWRSYAWNGTTYSEDSSGNLSTPVSGYVYGNPRIDLHESTGQVVATYFSYDVSPTYEGFALLGDINGNWIIPAGSTPFNAYRVSNSSVFLPASAGSLKGAVSVSVFHNKTFGTQVHFALNYIKNTGDTELWHLSMPISNLLNSNNRIYLDEDKLYVASNSNYNVRWCSIDTWAETDSVISGFNYRDWWTVAVPIANRTSGTADILTYRGIDSGDVFGPVNHTSGQLGGCENNLVDVAYGSNFITTVWRHTNCNVDSVLDSDDVVASEMHLTGAMPVNHFRVNNNAIGNQSAGSVAGSNSSKAILAWREDSNGDIFYKNVGSYINRIGLWEADNHGEGKVVVYPNPSDGKVLIDGLSMKPHNFKIINSVGVLIESGEMLYDGGFSLDFTHLKKGVYFLNIDDNCTKTLIIN